LGGRSPAGAAGRRAPPVPLSLQTAARRQDGRRAGPPGEGGVPLHPGRPRGTQLPGRLRGHRPSRPASQARRPQAAGPLESGSERRLEYDERVTRALPLLALVCLLAAPAAGASERSPRDELPEASRWLSFVPLVEARWDARTRV